MDEWIVLVMHATVCLLRARRPGDAAKSGQFEGQFAWDRYVPISVKGLRFSHYNSHIDILSSS